MMLLAQSAGDVEQTGDKRSVLTASIEKAHKQMTSLSAQFTQRKSSTLFTEDAVQKGKLNYKSPKMLRWEYTSPKAMTVIFANGKVMLKTDKGTVQNPNKMLNEMGTMIISTINGSFLNDASNFSARYYKNSKSRSRQVDMAVVGGTECLSAFHLNGFHTLMILDPQPCRPFDAERHGLNLGEGAAYIVIESAESACERNVKPLCVLSGYGRRSAG